MFDVNIQGALIPPLAVGKAKALGFKIIVPKSVIFNHKPDADSFMDTFAYSSKERADEELKI